MSTLTTTQPMQEIQCRSTDEVLEIATHLDPDSGERVVLWEEIHAGFRNADSIRNGKSVVPFLRGADLKEIIPRRIAYYPGTVLDVILDGHSRGHSHDYSHSHDHNELYLDASSTCCAPRELCHSIPCIPPITTETATCTPPVTVTFVDSSTDNNSLVQYSLSVDRSHLSSAVESNTPSLQDVVSTFSRQIEGLKMQLAHSQWLQQDANKRLDKAAEERAKNQEEMKKMQRIQQQTADQLVKKQEEMNEMQRRQQETADQLVKKQEEMNEMQKMAISILANIQSRVQSVVTQTYELHEYPIPRLFIVLPKDMEVFDKVKSPFATQFRLYFLCECGTHTMDESSKTMHEIHLAKHEGYDLEKPNEFFERYGPYILTLMNMIKYGITAAGCVVSPLPNLKIVEGIDTVQEHMKFVKEHIAPLVDSTINFLDDFKRKTDSEREPEFDQMEALEGADLRQLESYLKVKDKGRVLANLYRIVTTEGHVKWVCFDHYKATYRQSAVQHLREIVEVNHGTFVEETGMIAIKIATGTLAKQFYDAMIKARGIQELEITLEWDATMSDLRSLANAISMANVVHVSVDGSYFKSPPLDIVNRGQRFNPILQLASNSRIQVFRLRGFDNFGSRINKPALLASPKLQRLEIDFT
ncbi:hypothetical protein BGX31_001805 [Mortierella sp. GBA43]|nr:hypothetical protein BGX31_001805 [Mortierella sp. GBA43]